ncbi:MAG: hypothetical protein ACRETZ_18135 [Steroidobacteraceae bacterium]
MLHYGDQTYRQALQVALDPRLRATPAALKQHLALQLELQRTLDVLDRKINAAIEVRQKLAQAVAAHQIEAPAAAPVLGALEQAIQAVVYRGVRSSEGDVMHEMLLRSRLAYLQSDIGLDYAAPDPAMVAAVRKLETAAQQGEVRLQAATAAGRRML